MSFVTCNLLGPSATHFGLGNQMFGVAAALSYAKDTNKRALFPCLKEIEKYGSYSEIIFRNFNSNNISIINLKFNSLLNKNLQYNN